MSAPSGSAISIRSRAVAPIFSVLWQVLLGIALVALIVQGASAQGYPNGMAEGRNSARSPSVSDGVVTFRIFPGDCQARTYGDGRDESDCTNLNSKSYLAAADAPNGTAMRYAFDVRVVDGLTHAAFHNSHAVPITGGPDSRLSVAIWQGNLIKNYIATLDLDKTRGLTFLGKRCAGPGNLGDWTRFELLVRWSPSLDGIMQASCNGNVVYGVKGIATDQAPHCYNTNHCEPGAVKHPKRITAGFGIFFDKEMVGGVPTRPRIPQTGLSVQMRNFEMRRVNLR